MQRWACIDQGVVGLVVEQDDQPQIDGVWVPLDDGFGPGDLYADGVFSHPAPVDSPTKWLIDIGPFFDRFGAVKYSILTSNNPLVKALVMDIQCRKWIDLKRAEVAQGMDMLISAGVSGMTPELKEAILTTPPTADENLALRKLYMGLGYETAVHS